MPPFYYYYSNHLYVPPVAHTADMKKIPLLLQVRATMLTIAQTVSLCQSDFPLAENVS